MFFSAVASRTRSRAMPIWVFCSSARRRTVSRLIGSGRVATRSVSADRTAGLAARTTAAGGPPTDGAKAVSAQPRPVIGRPAKVMPHAYTKPRYRDRRFMVFMLPLGSSRVRKLYGAFSLHRLCGLGTLKRSRRIVGKIGECRHGRPGKLGQSKLRN